VEWYEIKLKETERKLQESTPSTSSDPKVLKCQPPLPPITGWGSFPSKDLPEHFNQGHIHHYMIESVQFIDLCTTNEDEDEDIQDLHTSKPLQKGKEYFKSGHVKNMKDSANATFYCLKATVMASYRVDTSYNVMLTISKSSGFVKDASCTCVASGMGRCNHVAAVLFALLDYIETFGTDKQSSTSKPCEWNKGRRSKKAPSKIFETKYPESNKKKKIGDIINFEPRPPSQQNKESPREMEGKLLFNIQSHNLSNSMWASLLRFHYSDYEFDNVIKERLLSQRVSLLENISVPDSTFPVQLTKDQRTDDWYAQRRVRITASTCKAVYTAKSDITVKNILSALLWTSREDSVTTLSMKYGNENEDTAISNYLQEKQKSSA